MKDKIILVFYVGCKTIPKYDVPYYMNKLASFSGKFYGKRSAERRKKKNE